ncbi:chemotaxis protein CheW [Paraferrimonas sedimenticola]|uniref:Chemotaxis protein W n=1 Tax=Paraferrimonas sedimenticola TaxID=375674 RepID=A0AA37RR91_9GAMM|nr:chemotaxis protein CheW [Paraferrimonas sedimenticola]GLP94951.1 chemotaxis protein W [Paraferrimonas sedimenticola]
MANPQQALSDYLECLLTPANQADSKSKKAVAEPKLASKSASKSVNPVKATTVESNLAAKSTSVETAPDCGEAATAAKPAVEQTALPDAPKQTVTAEPKLVSKPVAQTASEPPKPSEVPSLFFSAENYTAAIPLTELGEIVAIDGLHQVPGGEPWILGVQNYRGKSLKVVDWPAWIHGKAGSIDNYHFVLVLKDSHFGIACQKDVYSRIVGESDIGWRKGDSGPKWSAGMIKSDLCHLLDSQQLIAALDGDNS